MHLVWSSLWGLLLRLTASAPHVDKLPVFLWMHRSYSLGTSVRYLQLLLLNIIVILLQKCLGWDRAMQPNIGGWETSFHHSVGQDEPSGLTSQCWIATLLFSGISIPTRIGSFPTPSHGNSLKECQVFGTKFSAQLCGPNNGYVPLCMVDGIHLGHAVGYQNYLLFASIGMLRLVHCTYWCSNLTLTCFLSQRLGKINLKYWH